ncbi:MAG: TIGR04086 family membrane protein [Clostridia bacterium]|nr:TIGR04086 family membrane protein [Clostridia bacterium]
MREKLGGSFFGGVIKGTATAIIVTLIGVLIFAAIVKFALLGSSVIKAVNQFIKILSIFLGCNFSIRGRQGLIRGMLIGVLSTVITHLLFALFGGQANFDYHFFLDVLFGLILGAISGIIVVNVKGKE